MRTLDNFHLFFYFFFEMDTGSLRKDWSKKIIHYIKIQRPGSGRFVYKEICILREILQN